MKKILFSTVAAVALSSSAIAGGDMPVPAPVVVSESALYVGIGYSAIGGEYTSTIAVRPGRDDEIDADALLLQVGYQFNQYLALEGRYTLMGDVTLTSNIGDPDVVFTGDAYNAALYLKAMLPAGDFSLYALAGYGATKIDDPVIGTLVDDSDFQYGAGVSYKINENISLFSDFVVLYDEETTGPNNITENLTINAASIGVTYTF